jgi:hypothetical protein
VTYSLDIDPLARDQITALPKAALSALAEAFSALELVPWSGWPLNDRNPDAPVRQLPFGAAGMITYLIVDQSRRVDVLIVTWAG